MAAIPRKWVQSKATGHKFAVVASAFDPEAHKDLNEDGNTVYGTPREPVHKSASTSKKSGQKATTTKKETA